MSCLKIKNLTVLFETPQGKVTAAEEITLTHKEKETLALVGETGCGKSIIAKAVLSLLPSNAITTGEILYKGNNLLTLEEKELTKIRGKEIAIVFQNPTLSLNPVYSIAHQLHEVYSSHMEVKKKLAREYSRTLLKKMSFSNPDEILKSYPYQISEGMKQRVLIAASFALNPRIIIADEPTKGLDELLKEEIIKELTFIKENKNTSLFYITHDLTAAEKLGDRIAIMYCGEIVEISPASEFLSNPYHPYSQGLIQSLPENKFEPIPGTSPSMISPPKGCRFHPRCRQKKEICSREKPELIKKNGKEIRCHIYS